MVGRVHSRWSESESVDVLLEVAAGQESPAVH